MNVKQEVFEKTKQTILKNKLQFLEQQLKESAKRKERLFDENKLLKSEIRLLKTQQTFKSKKKEESSFNSSKECSFFDNNKSIIKDKVGYPQVSFQLFFNDNNEEGKQNQDSNKWVNHSEDEKQIKILEQALRAQYEQKLKLLAERQKKLGFLKQQCQHKNKSEVHQQALVKYLSVNSQNKIPIENISKKNSQNYQVQKKMISLNANYEKENYNDPIKQRKRIEKSIQRIYMKNRPSNTIRLHEHDQRYNVNKNYTNKSLNSSLIHTRREEQKKPLERASPSNTFNFNKFHRNSGANQSLNSSKISTNSLNSSLIVKNKSYSKIITGLQCEGCGHYFKPNLYYTHIDECREYIVMQLEKQKEEIDEKINETLNFSIGYY